MVCFCWNWMNFSMESMDHSKYYMIKLILNLVLYFISKNIPKIHGLSKQMRIQMQFFHVWRRSAIWKIRKRNITHNKEKFSVENQKNKWVIKNKLLFRIDKISKKVLRKKAYLLEHQNNLIKDWNLREIYFLKDFQA